MQIREATEGDIPGIVDLLRLSLGESLMPKSVEYWGWKHLENPFGPSPVLICENEGALVGVRAFMRWDWILKGNLYKAVRAVDTATHPAYQGKGIFKKLTLALVDYCKQHNIDFVFNTPNTQSKPGYLKMGWEEAGKVPLHLSLQRPIGILKNLIYPDKREFINQGNDSITYYLGHTGAEILLENYLKQMGNVVTRVSVPYLKWRYQRVPVASYVAFGDENGKALTSLIIGRVKRTRLGLELRITDCFKENDETSDQLVQNLKDYIKTVGIDYVAVSNTFRSPLKKILKGYNITGQLGPMVTIRTLNWEESTYLKKFEHWSPSLGDLELF